MTDVETVMIPVITSGVRKGESMFRYKYSEHFIITPKTDLC